MYMCYHSLLFLCLQTSSTIITEHGRHIRRHSVPRMMTTSTSGCSNVLAQGDNLSGGVAVDVMLLHIEIPLFPSIAFSKQLFSSKEDVFFMY